MLQNDRIKSWIKLNRNLNKEKKHRRKSCTKTGIRSRFFFLRFISFHFAMRESLTFVYLITEFFIQIFNTFGVSKICSEFNFGDYEKNYFNSYHLLNHFKHEYSKLLIELISFNNLFLLCKFLPQQLETLSWTELALFWSHRLKPKINLSWNLFLK